MNVRRYLCVLGLLALSVLPTARPAHALAVSDWIRWPEFTNVIISPDGKYLAVVSAMKNHPQRYQLVVLPAKSVVEGNPKVTGHYGLTDYEKFAYVFWINNERIAGATSIQYGGFDRPFLTGKLYAINADGSQQLVLAGGGFWFGGVLQLRPKPSNRSILIYGSEGGAWGAYRLDTYTESHHRVASSPVTNGELFADHNGDVRIAEGLNQKTGWPELYYRPAGSMDWKNESALLGKDEAAAALANGGPIMFGPDNQTVYYRDWTDNSAETMGLYSYNLDTGEKKLIYANPTVDVGGAEFNDFNSFLESFSRDRLVALRIMPGIPETVVLDPDSHRVQLLQGLAKALPKDEISITSWTQDGTEAVVRTWSDTQAPAYYLFSANSKPSLTLLFQATPWIKPGDLSPMRPISYQSRDGLSIHGYLTLPPNAGMRNLPLVVYVHGGPHGIRYDWGFDPSDFDSVATQILANRGYAVLAVNYRGSGGYGLKFMEAGFLHWGDTMQNDLADGVAWAVKKGYADPKRICIFGASYGGYSALMSAERFPDLYRCAIGYDGVYDLALQETRSSDTARVAGGRLYLHTVLGDDAAQLRAFSPADNVASLKAPVLLLHGGRDVRAPVGGYDEMVAAIKGHGTPLETLYYRNEGHGFYQPAHRTKAWDDILAFLGRYIGPAGFTPSPAAGTR